MKSQMEIERERTEIEKQSIETGEKTKEHIEDTNICLAIFNKVKDRLLQESFECLEAEEGRFVEVAEWEVKVSDEELDACVLGIDGLNEALQSEMSHLQETEAELEAVSYGRHMRDKMQATLTDSCRKLMNRKEQVQGASDAFTLSRNQIETMKDDLGRAFETAINKAGFKRR